MPMPPIQCYAPQGQPRLAVISFEASQQAGQQLLRLSKGDHLATLALEKVYGPFPEAEIQTAADQLLAQLAEEGYLRTADLDLVEALSSDRVEVRARAALRAGWRKATTLVDQLIAQAESAPEVCSLLDGLGRLGDAKAAPLLRAYAGRKLLSRRRSAIEGLIRLGDETGLAEVRAQLEAAMADPIRDALRANALDCVTKSGLDALQVALEAVPKNRRAFSCDQLYEYARPLTVAAARASLQGLPFGQPFVWRYVKSLFKRSLLRDDFVTFGWLAVEIERQGRVSVKVRAQVKSGLDGKQRETAIFSRKTCRYLQRATWRYLRKLAAYQPQDYTFAAAELLIHYRAEDGGSPTGSAPSHSHCYLLQQILHGASSRLVCHHRTLRFRYRNPTAAQARSREREERFPELWDAYPDAYLRLLANAHLEEVHAFAHAAVRLRHPGLLQSAAPNQLASMLGVPFAETHALAQRELARRFDPTAPDWALLLALLESEGELAVSLGCDYLRQSRHAWILDGERCMWLLTESAPLIQSTVAGMLVQTLPQSAPAVRVKLAKLIRQRLCAPEKTAFEALAQVCEGTLLPELNPLFSYDDLIALIQAENEGAQAIAAMVLGTRPEAIHHLGLERLLALADHSLGALRTAALKMLESAVQAGEADIETVFSLCEGQFSDTRTRAAELLSRRVNCFTPEGYLALVSLLDSSYPEPRAVGLSICQANLDRLNASDLLQRLAEHPAPTMRPFVFTLLQEHLEPGLEALRKVLPFCRCAILDLRPSLPVKRGVIRFLAKRGQASSEEAALVGAFFTNLLGTKGRFDFEQILEETVRLKLAFPEAAPAVSFPTTEVVAP